MNEIEIRFRGAPNRVKVVIEVDIENTVYPAPLTFMVGDDEYIARRAVLDAIFKSDDYRGEHDERGPYRTMLDGRAKIRMRRAVEDIE